MQARERERERERMSDKPNIFQLLEQKNVASMFLCDGFVFERGRKAIKTRFCVSKLSLSSVPIFRK